MAIKRYLQGIAIVVLILGMLSVAMAFSITSPSSNNIAVNNTTGDPARTFTIITSHNANITWYVNGTPDGSTTNATISNYINSTFVVGYWNVTAVATNSSNSSQIDRVTWWWTVSEAASVETAPNITSQTAINITDTSADIKFSVNQSNAISRVRYSKNPSLSSAIWSIWNNNSSPRTINISGLDKSTSYYYSVYAYNESNHNLDINTSIESFTTLDPTEPNISNITQGIPSENSISISFDVNQSNAKTKIKYGEDIYLSNSTILGTLRTIILSSLNQGTKYYYSIFAYNLTNQTYFSNSTIYNFTTKYPAPPIVLPSPTTTTLEITAGESTNLSVTIGDQVGTLTWFENDVINLTSKSVNSSEIVIYTFSKNTKGTYNITANLSNVNGSTIRKWTIKVNPTTFSSGNRIWDGGKPEDFALIYSWNPMTFSGFYYNAKDDVGNEKINITLGGYSTRTISKNNLVYTTSPQEVSFLTTKFGKYQVIGFMAEKYFAGYIANTTPPNPKPSTTFDGISAVGQGQLHKVLIDDDTKRTISVGGTIALQEGYVLKARDIDLVGRTMLLSLLKDGNEVDVSPLAADQTYIYKKTVGGVSDLPLIMVRFDSVFSGNELQVAFMKGLFQISEYPTIIKTGNKFRNMEVTTVSNSLIEMKNSNDIGLTKGTTADVMGDVKILVANNESVTRFALSVEKTGNFEIRSTVYKGDDASPVLVWTPYNFGMNIGKTSIGFFYDLDEGIGSETLTLSDKVSGSIPDTKLVYTTNPQEVKFIYTGFGKYNVIGFMADKYFAGYTSNTGISSLGKIITKPSTDFSGISSLANGALHKVLVDDDTKHTISVGGTIALKDGYVIKATDIDLNARVMLLSLLKDGAEVDMTPLGAGETYIYTKTVGGTEALPLIMVRFENVFSGQELQVAFLKGIFQISDTPTIVKVADQFGKMEVRSVSANSITMSNDGSIDIGKNKNDVLMGNLRLKTADNDKLRFYFAVDVTADMIANQLAIDAPTKAMAGDTIKIKITAGAVGMDNATVTVGTETGTTDKDGILNYTLPRALKGTYSIAASKTGYEKVTQNIEIEKYVDYRLSIEAPSQSNQFETITIKVLYNGTAMSGAAVTFDNATIGTSDSNGEVTYRLETSGTHNISASKKSYITVTRDIEIRAPYSEFKGLDINITPNPGFVGEPFLVRSNITNIGTMSDSLQVDLIVNGTAVDNKTVTIGAKEKVEVNFTRTEAIAGNVTVEIMGQSMVYEAKENPTNYLLIAAIVTGIGAIIIYILTSKGLLSLEILKHKSIVLKDAVSMQTHKLSMLFKK
jgi:S-layer protein (TIGR01567 family)